MQIKLSSLSIQIGNLKYTSEGIKCDRTTKVGNPFLFKTEADRSKVIKGYRQYLYLVAMTWEDPLNAAQIVAKDLNLKISSTYRAPKCEEVLALLSHIEYQIIYNQLQGNCTTLLCWCSPKKCHCDILKNYFLYSVNNN